MTIAAWVVGRGGLLGSALERSLRRAGRDVYVPEQRFVWADEALLSVALPQALDGFTRAADASERWEIWWAAGIGTMASAEETLRLETEVLAELLACVGRSSLRPLDGRLALASSAGAIYAGSPDQVISELSVESPTTPYARAKLAQERLVEEHASRSGCGVLIARISTVYGVGQASAKQQGLLTHLSRCMVRNQPIRIFVPLDTIRDYIAADDAADLMVDAIGLVAARQSVRKIIASEQPVTISEIVSIFKRIARRRPRIVTGTTPSTGLYANRMQFRSVVAPLGSTQGTSLMVGIARIIESERLRYVGAGREERHASDGMTA